MDAFMASVSSLHRFLVDAVVPQSGLLRLIWDSVLSLKRTT